VFLYKYWKKQQVEFNKYYPILMEEINERKFEEAILILDKLMWNSNMKKQYFFNILNEINSFESKGSNNNLDEIQNMINKVFIKKGWGKLNG
jgi:hypothetical protein